MEVGKLQARSLVSKLRSEGKGSGTIVMINGKAADICSGPAASACSQVGISQ